MKKILIALVLMTSFVFGAININTASKKELMTLEGIGAKKAEQIIQYREKNKFKSIDEIKNIKGIGDKMFNKIKDNITIDSSKDSPKTDAKQTKDKKSKSSKDSKSDKSTKKDK